MADELAEILGDMLPDRMTAEEVGSLILRGAGHEYLPEVIWNLTNHRCQTGEAASLWQGISDHRRALNKSLDRDVGLRVAALDYFSNILGKHARPRVVHPELLEHLYQQATNDALTGLANRRFYRARLADELVRARRYSSSFVQLLFDVDDFKRLNDTRGHQIGDRVLIQVADVIRACIRESDVGARWGGEEFAVLMLQTSKDGGALVAERIRTQVERQLAGDRVTISGGVAVFPEDGSDEDSLYQFADRALYRAKHEGKNRICLSPLERRQHPRFPARLPFCIRPVGAEQWVLEGETSNISRGGLGFRHDKLVWVADEVRGHVAVGGRKADFAGRIAHLMERPFARQDVGISFTEISPENADLLLAGLDTR